MGRHAKGIEDTRTALLEAAWSLIARIGYEAATIEAIIERTGVSKGAFYHHFQSKEDILDAIVEMMTVRSMEALQSVMSDGRLSGLARLDRLIYALRNWKVTNINAVAGVGRALYLPENLELKDKLIRSSVDALAPVLAEAISKCAAEGLLSVRDPETAARMLLHLSMANSDLLRGRCASLRFGPQAVAEVMDQIDLLLESFERILAAPPGCLTRPKRRDVEAVCRLFCREGEMQ